MTLIFNPITQLTSEHFDLLLEADPSKELVENYFNRSTTFEVLKDFDLVGIIVLIETRPDSIEIVNISVHQNHQNKGYGQETLRFAIQYAKENNYDHFSLDSGHQRKDAHRLYLNHGLDITAHHFGKDVKDLK